MRVAVSLFLILLLTGPQAMAASARHGASLGGPLKYGPDFGHFDYVNPNAPKGGRLRLHSVGTFDSLNPFIAKGVAASGTGLLFDTLMAASDDEPFAQYGLLARTVTIADDDSWVRFELRPEARFHDGSPVMAEDVVFSFDILKKKGSPHYARYYHDVVRAKAEGPRTVRFDFTSGVNEELPLIVGQIPVLSKKDWEGVDFTASSIRIPVGSGPYKVEGFKIGKSITYKRNPDYWGKDLPVNRGRYNFDRIAYEYYRDETISLEGFKAGQYDFRQETTAKVWATQYTGAPFEKKRILKREVLHEIPTGMQGFVFNVRRKVFSDVRVREAIGMAFDFEWSNIHLFHGQYTRTESYFSNSEMAATGTPTSAELALLSPFKKKLPPRVFGEAIKPPATDGTAKQQKAAQACRPPVEVGRLRGEGRRAGGSCRKAADLRDPPSQSRIRAGGAAVCEEPRADRDHGADPDGGSGAVCEPVPLL